MWKWLKNKGTAVVQAIAPDNIKSKSSVFALNHAPTGILSKLPTLETALIKNVVLGPNAHERTLSIARPLVKRLINHWHKDDKRRLEQIFGRYTQHYPDLQSFLLSSSLTECTNNIQSPKPEKINRKSKIYPDQLTSRKVCGLIMRKLSETVSRKDVHFLGTSVRRKVRNVVANWLNVL